MIARGVLRFGWIFALVGAMAWASVRAADPVLRPSKPEVRRELEAVVAEQLRAWREDRPIDAYGYASSALRAQFPFEAFVVMVRRGYPGIVGNRRAEFSVARDNGGSAEVSVQVFPQKGEAVRYRYRLVREEAGWRINGVTPDTRPRDEV